jgi:transposase
MASVRSTSTVSLELLKDCVSKLPLKHWLPKRKSTRGRAGYTSESLFLAYLLKLRENIPHDTKLAQKLKENESYRNFCGFSMGKTPSHDTLSKFNRNLTKERLKTILLKLDGILTKEGVFDQDELAINATDILSNSRNKHNPDLEAGIGYKTDKERFHGYWVVYLTGTTSEMVRAVEVTPANIHQSVTAQKLFRQLHYQDLRNATLFIADSAYDDKKTYSKAIELGLVPLITYNPKRSKIVSFDKLKPSNWRKKSIGFEGIQLRQNFYNFRSAVERYQSSIKELLNGRSVPVRGLLKVKKHLYGITILSQIYGLINWSLFHQISLPQQLPLDLFF